MKQTGKDTQRLTNEVMRRFVDYGMVRGGNTGLWPESPGYGFSPVLNILSWEQPLKRAGQPVEIVVTHMDGRKKHIPVF